MIKKISQLNRLPEDFYDNYRIEELSGEFPELPKKKAGMLFEVSYETADTASEAGANEAEYYTSYAVTLSGLDTALEVSRTREALSSALSTILDGGITAITGTVDIGTRGERAYDRMSADPNHFYEPCTSATVNCYSDFNLQNNLTAHGIAEFHNKVVLTCNTDLTNTNNPILDVQGIANFRQTIYGTAMRARWADLAEIYDADAKYEPGTLVCFGGEKEITIATEKANAVVTSNPGFILNGDKNSEMANPTGIALIGKVPIKIRGPVKKFDNIVLSKTEPGIGIVYNFSLPYEIIGKALENNPNGGEKLVLCATNLNLK